jgi:acetyltransferase-like isoleucine patch superfamily enzyme
MEYYKHHLSEVLSNKIGVGTRIWQFVVISNSSVVGENCNICSHCFIEDDVIVGNEVTIKSGVYLWSGIIIKDNVFIGPNVVFTNDIYPRSKLYKEPTKTVIEKGASLGANSTILCGVKVGEYSMTGMGSVVTSNLKSFGLYFGNPAKFRGWIDERGEKLIYEQSTNLWRNSENEFFIETETGLKKVNQ